MIRAGHDGDLAAIARLFNEVYPHWTQSEAGLRHRLSSEPDRARRRTWVVEEDGELAGSSSSSFDFHSSKEDVAFVQVMVAARHRRRGLGDALLAAAMTHLTESGARKVITHTTEQEGRRFLEARDFRHTLTGRLSRVDPRAVDLSQLARLEREKAKEGFTLAPLSALRDRPELIHAVDAAASRDIPLDEPITDVRFDEWERYYWRHPDLSLDGSFAVLHDGRPVAFTMIRADPATRRASNDMTGTLAEYRGRGLARLAKLASLRWAAEHGITQIVTGNDETNAPMLAVNARLGYMPFASEYSYVREL